MQASTLLLHAIPGGIGIVSGYIALSVAKGGEAHRRGGVVFVVAMLVLAVSGAVMASISGSEGSILGGVLTFYLVVTAFATVRPLGDWSPRLAPVMLLLAVAILLFAVALGVDAIARGGVREGIPAVVLFKFALVALLGAIGDVRVLRSGPLTGRPRLVRHLWRMCFALYIAAASFFLGQMQVLPEALRIPAMLAVPAFAPLLAMFFWLWRVRVRRPLRRMRGVTVGEAF